MRDIDWPHENALKIIKGEDIGARFIKRTEFSGEKGRFIKVIGKTNMLN